MDASPSSVRDNIVMQCVIVLAVVTVGGMLVAVLVDVMTGVIGVLAVTVIVGFVMLEVSED